MYVHIITNKKTMEKMYVQLYNGEEDDFKRKKGDVALC
jgi:hypothetical protein